MYKPVCKYMYTYKPKVTYNTNTHIYLCIRQYPERFPSQSNVLCGCQQANHAFKSWLRVICSVSACVDDLLPCIRRNVVFYEVTYLRVCVCGCVFVCVFVCVCLCVFPVCVCVCFCASVCFCVSLSLHVAVLGMLCSFAFSNKKESERYLLKRTLE